MPSMTRASDDKPDDLRTVRWAAENLDGLRLHDPIPPGGWDFAQGVLGALPARRSSRRAGRSRIRIHRPC
jgi:hypothetical protein